MNVRVVLKIFKMMRQIRERETWTRRELESHQGELLRKLRTRAYAHSRFYQKFHKGLYERPLQDLPVLTKDTMMENFDELVTDPVVHLSDVEAHIVHLSGDERFQNKYWVNATSGSSGRKGVFIYNSDEWATVVASYGRSFLLWTGFRMRKFRRTKRATLTSITPWHQTARVSTTLPGLRFANIAVDSGVPVQTMVERLNTWQPEVLGAYATTARTLAEEQLSGHLNISPSLIVVGGEVLTPDSRRRIESVWGKKLFNQYGATETGVFAQECEKHCGLHVSEDLFIFEVVDKANQPVAPGVYGDKVLVTVLFNHTQPLIRYEISDIIRLAGVSCPCGRPYALIDDVQGRTEDLLPFSTTDGGVITLHPIVLERIMENVPCRGWQIIQDENALTILLKEIQESFEDNRLADAIQKELEGLGAIVPPIAVKRVSEIPRGNTAKTPLIKTNVKR